MRWFIFNSKKMCKGRLAHQPYREKKQPQKKNISSVMQTGSDISALRKSISRLQKVGSVFRIKLYLILLLLFSCSTNGKKDQYFNCSLVLSL